MNKRHYEHTLPNIRGSLSNTYGAGMFGLFGFMILHFIRVTKNILYLSKMKPYLMYHQVGLHGTSSTTSSYIKSGLMSEGSFLLG